jgi:hypothetical protein
MLLILILHQQFAITIGQIQAPEDVRPAAPRPTPPPPAPASPPNNLAAAPGSQAAPSPATGPPQPAVATQTAPERPGLLRYLFDHIRSDPSARLCKYRKIFARNVHLHETPRVPHIVLLAGGLQTCHRTIGTASVHRVTLLKYVATSNLSWRSSRPHKWPQWRIPGWRNCRSPVLLPMFVIVFWLYCLFLTACIDFLACPKNILDVDTRRACFYYSVWV